MHSLYPDSSESSHMYPCQFIGPNSLQKSDLNLVSDTIWGKELICIIIHSITIFGLGQLQSYYQRRFFFRPHFQDFRLFIHPWHCVIEFISSFIYVITFSRDVRSNHLILVMFIIFLAFQKCSKGLCRLNTSLLSHMWWSRIFILFISKIIIVQYTTIRIFFRKGNSNQIRKPTTETPKGIWVNLSL
jgi:hypothetical protein